jgi:uncharacterized membrane protein
MRFEATIDVAAPAEKVFDVYADVEHWPDWTSTVTSVERLDDGPFRLGSRARVRQPRLPTAVWEVTELVPGRTFTWVSRGPGLVTTGRHTVQPAAGPGTATAIAELEQAGPVGRLVGLLYARLIDRYLRTEVRGLKAFCEGSGS